MCCSLGYALVGLRGDGAEGRRHAHFLTESLAAWEITEGDFCCAAEMLAESDYFRTAAHTPNGRNISGQSRRAGAVYFRRLVHRARPRRLR